MQITKIGFSQFWNEPREWVLEPIELRQINLIVGKNASGKSRTLNVINGLAALVSGRQTDLPKSSEFEATFEGDGSIWKYYLKIENKLVVKERLTKNSEVFLERGHDGAGIIRFEELNGALTKFQSPPSALAVFSRQDTIQHNFLSWLKGWADGTFFYPFGLDLGHRALAARAEGVGSIDLYNPMHTTAVFAWGRKNFGEAYIDAIRADLKAVGYAVTDVSISAPLSVEVTTAPVQVNFEVLFAHEEGLKAPTEQFEMSQGMFRALAISIHLNYGLLSGKSGCIIIDDIGEGLDFERSNSLIRVIIEKIAGTKLQLMMSTNDRFVMNSVPLKYWSILDRKGSIVRAFNDRNAKEIFESFKFTGLNNFDFFATDFLNSQSGSAGEKNRNLH